jgi:hypothetical protein
MASRWKLSDEKGMSRGGSNACQDNEERASARASGTFDDHKRKSALDFHHFSQQHHRNPSGGGLRVCADRSLARG